MATNPDPDDDEARASQYFAPVRVRNLTLDRLRINFELEPDSRAQQLSLAPLEARSLEGVIAKQRSDQRDRRMATLGEIQSLGLIELSGGEPLDVSRSGKDNELMVISMVVVLGGLAALTRLIARKIHNAYADAEDMWLAMHHPDFWRTQNTLAWVIGAVLLILASAVVSLLIKALLDRASPEVKERLATRFRAIPSRLTRRIASTLALALGFGAPVATVVLMGTTAGAGSHASWAALFDIHVVVRVLLAGIAAVLPAMLYFMRARERRTTLRERFYRDVLYLDETLETLGELQARYGEEIDEVFGSIGDRKELLEPQTLAPVLGSTVVLGLGWSLALLYDPSGVVPQNALAAPASASVVWAFLGAYFFSVGVVSRGHLRGDLEAKSFSSMTVRLLTVLILGWLLDFVPQPEGLALEEGVISSAVAFCLGIFPDTWLNQLQERVRYHIDGLVEKRPLTELEGIDLYDRSRLSEEGINNIEALAHHDLIRLLLRLRIPASRLIDWVDQAILNLHTAFVPRPRASAEASASASAAASASAPTIYAELRSIGIRTATDLEQAYGPDTDPDSEAARAELEAIVGGPGRLTVLMRALGDDQWLSFIRSWKTRSVAPPGERELPKPLAPSPPNPEAA